MYPSGPPTNGSAAANIKPSIMSLGL
jgi:hypothetical protein